jgi:predicted esterase
VSEFAVRHPRRYGGIAIFSGGVIGPLGMARDDRGELAGTPVLVGSSDVDPHVPKERVEETAGIFRRLGAEVTLRLYPGMPHTINSDEITRFRQMVDALVG